MTTNKQIKNLIITGGVIQLLCALLHFTWPFALIQTPEYTNMASSAKDLFMLLFFATGLCLLMFAILSFYFAKNTMASTSMTLVYILSQSILWFFRLIFEFIWPVQSSIFILQNPSIFIQIGATVIILIYGLAFYLLLPEAIQRHRIFVFRT